MADNTRQLPNKTITKRGVAVLVCTSATTIGQQTVFVITCSHDDVVHTTNMTVGAADGTRPEYSTSQMQTDLDNHRDVAADECAWIHGVSADAALLT